MQLSIDPPRSADAVGAGARPRDSSSAPDRTGVTGRASVIASGLIAVSAWIGSLMSVSGAIAATLVVHLAAMAGAGMGLSNNYCH